MEWLEQQLLDIYIEEKDYKKIESKLLLKIHRN